MRIVTWGGPEAERRNASRHGTPRSLRSCCRPAPQQDRRGCGRGRAAGRSQVVSLGLAEAPAVGITRRAAVVPTGVGVGVRRGSVHGTAGEGGRPYPRGAPTPGAPLIPPATAPASAAALLGGFR